MFKASCRKCGKVIEGYNRGHVEYLFMQHNLKHRWESKKEDLNSIKKQEVKQNG